jgi:CheY-like chemotaxis protein
MVEDDPALRAALSTLIASKDIQVVAVGSSNEAFDQLCAEPFGCVVLDLGLPDKQAGLNLLARLRADQRTAELPIIVHTGFPLSAEEVLDIESQARTVVVIKGERSPQRVMEEVRLFLHRVRRDLPRQRQTLTEVVHNPDPGLRGRRVLIVDDDMRNVYSLTALLRARGLQVEVASDGRGALDKLGGDQNGIELVLMDIMMPGMDGYQTMTLIRQDPAFRRLPIVALTAKAMKGDREKCLEAGASDYLAKPVNTEQLLSALRMWLHR